MNKPNSSKLVESAPAVFFSSQQPFTLNAPDLEMLKQKAASSPKRRARICAHASPSDLLHEMLIALDASTYVRPHRHLDKCESMHVIEGRAALLYFNESGGFLAMRIIGHTADSDGIYCRTNSAIYHTVIVLTDCFVFHETVQGPFQPHDTEYAPWAPLEDDAVAVAAYRKILTRFVEEGLKPDSSWRTATI